MRKIALFLSISIIANVSLFSNVLAGQKFAFVDLKKIEEESAVAKDLREYLTKKQAKLEVEVKKEKEKAQLKISEFQKNAGKSNSAKQEKLQKELIEIDNLLQEKVKDLENIKNSALEKVNEKIRSASENIAEKKGYSAVFTTNAALYHDKSDDITDDVISKLSKETINFE